MVIYLEKLEDYYTIKSPDIPGLYLADKNRGEVLRQLPEALEKLEGALKE
jgi:predicted RNase H-like HicB family nuclease